MPATNVCEQPCGEPQPRARPDTPPLCSTSGLIRFRVRPGEEIREGQLLAEVFSAFGSREESLRATADGFVLGLEDHARALPGREFIAIAERH